MKNSKKKSIIEKYYNEVYDIDMIVANKYTTLEQLKKKYTYYDGVVLDKQVEEGNACVCKCKNIKTGRCCLLVKFNIDYKNTKEFYGIVSHEATHVALDIYELIEQQIYFSSPEPFCYLVEWATERICKTLMK